MVNSRDIKELHPHVHGLAARFLEEAKKSGIEVIIISTYRDAEYQNHLYAQGRTRPGPECTCGGKKNKIGTCRKHPLGLVVTKARAGKSYHEHKIAFDILPMRGKTSVWSASDPLYDQLGAIGKAVGLEWAGDWKGFKEKAHFQYTGGLTLAELNAGKTIKA